jgi:O-antigen/teichoic acid export membrane protein
MAEELKFVAFIVSTTFCFQLILKLITTILTALQSPALASLINTITQGLILLIISLSIITSEKGSLLILSLITGLIQLGTLLVVSIFLFSKKLKHYRPQRKYVKFEYAKDLMTLGLKFFFLQILSLLFYSTNNIIIAQINGPEDVTIYNIAYRYMNVMLMIFSIIITPFWSAFTEAKTKNDIPWMNDSYKKLLILYIAIIIIGLIMTLISSPIYKIWLGSKVIIPFYLTLSLFIFNAINIWGTLFDTLIYGIGKIKLTMYKSMFICIINVPITILGCKSAGMIGLVIAQIIIAIPFIWMGPYQTKKLINNKADGIWNK